MIIATHGIVASQIVTVPVATAATSVTDTSFVANWNAYTGAGYYLLDVSLNSSFSSFVSGYQNFVAISNSATVTGLSSNTIYYYRVRAVTGVDSDFVSYATRVYTASGALSYTEMTATEQLVKDLKGYSIWSKMQAIYPMVGASAAACAQNLKSSSFTGTFSGGWTYASTGVTGNGTSAYMDTQLKQSDLLQNSQHLCIYSRTNRNASEVDLGMYTLSSASYLAYRFSGNIYPTIQTTEINGGATPYTTSLGLIIGNRTNSTQSTFYHNGSLVGTYSRTSTSRNNLYNLYLGCYNGDGTASAFSLKQFALASLGDGLTDTEASNYYTAVQAFQTTLSRQV